MVESFFAIIEGLDPLFFLLAFATLYFVGSRLFSCRTWRLLKTPILIGGLMMLTLKLGLLMPIDEIIHPIGGERGEVTAPAVEYNNISANITPEYTLVIPEQELDPESVFSTQTLDIGNLLD